MQSQPMRADGLDGLLEDYVAALLAPDARHARALVDAAADDGVAVRRLYVEVLQPAMQRIGELWEEARISVAQEHMATQITHAVLAPLALRLGGTGTGRGRVAVVSGSPGELHALGLQMIADFLEADGWTVRALGPDTPADELAGVAREHRADVVALSTALPTNLLAASHACAQLRHLERPPLIVAGGQAYQGSRDRALAVGADEFAPDPEALIAVLTERFGGDSAVGDR
jgi:MerR family transcriptional regulator, light-induced transcriptional regulator